MRPDLVAYINVTAASYSVKADERVIEVNWAGAVTVTLPSANAALALSGESTAAANNTVATKDAETVDDHYGADWCSVDWEVERTGVSEIWATIRGGAGNA